MMSRLLSKCVVKVSFFFGGRFFRLFLFRRLCACRLGAADDEAPSSREADGWPRRVELVVLDGPPARAGELNEGSSFIVTACSSSWEAPCGKSPEMDDRRAKQIN